MKTETHPCIEDFKDFLEADKKSPLTIMAYYRTVKNMLSWLKKSPEQTKQEDLERYKEYLAIEKNYSKNSLYTTIKGIQSFFRFLKLDTAEGLIPPKRGASIPKYLSEEEAHELLECAKDNKRDYAILLVLGYTGLRVSELCELNVDDIDFSERKISVWHGKGDKGRIVIMEEKTEKALKDYIMTRRCQAFSANSVLFVSRENTRLTKRSVERIVSHYAKLAGITKKVTPHILRHTLATTLLRRGADIRFIQRILGHSSVATTQVYTHVDDETLRKAYEKAKPEY